MLLFIFSLLYFYRPLLIFSWLVFFQKMNLELPTERSSFSYTNLYDSSPSSKFFLSKPKNNIRKGILMKALNQDKIVPNLKAVVIKQKSLSVLNLENRKFPLCTRSSLDNNSLLKEKIDEIISDFEPKLKKESKKTNSMNISKNNSIPELPTVSHSVKESNKIKNLILNPKNTKGLSTNSSFKFSKNRIHSNSLQEELMTKVEKAVHNDTQVLSKTPMLLSDFSMNNFLLRDFYSGKENDQNNVKHSKRIHKIYNNYNEVKKKMNAEKYEKINDKYVKLLNQNNKFENDSIALSISKINSKNWSKKYFLKANKKKITEEEFSLFKKKYKAAQKKQILAKSLDFANTVANLDIKESKFELKQTSELTGEIDYETLNRSIRKNRLFKTKIAGDAELELMEKEKETEEDQRRIFNILKLVGNPNNIKLRLKKETLRKFRYTSGVFFGIPV